MTSCKARLLRFPPPRPHARGGPATDREKGRTIEHAVTMPVCVYYTDRQHKPSRSIVAVAVVVVTSVRDVAAVAAAVAATVPCIGPPSTITHTLLPPCILYDSLGIVASSLSVDGDKFETPTR